MVTTAMFRSLSVSVLYNNCAVLPHPGCEAIPINTRLRDLVDELSSPREVSMFLTHCTPESRQNYPAYQTDMRSVHNFLVKHKQLGQVLHNFAVLVDAPLDPCHCCTQELRP